ncbi:hypothetical protein MLD38_029663 [Melastoma candidum]|uniref:Uncharacterized protein n=1 Tax=Melastoma candidum TaxID=119954 RepID=A0ACB9N6W8_9MYRT|nr:hypothetical protein MLD38_029663 [Melastoma candidum]
MGTGWTRLKQTTTTPSFDPWGASPKTVLSSSPANDSRSLVVLLVLILVELLKWQKSWEERKRQPAPALSARKTRLSEIAKTPQMLPRWKGKTSQATALANPLSQIVSLLKSSLVQSDVRGLLSGSSVLVSVTEELSDLFNRSCFGRQLLTTDKDMRWFQLGSEEAFYLHYCLGCLHVLGEDGVPETSEDLWRHMTNRNSSFPESYRAYSHLRGKNWIVRPGSLYGVDFVAYRHHPALVHSEYAVLVLKDGDGHDNNGRLRVWSDFHCTVRLCGSVAKQLLVLYVNRGGQSLESPLSVGLYTVEERLISRWSPKECREDTVGNESVPQQSECL